MTLPGFSRFFACFAGTLGIALAGCRHLAAPPAPSGQASFEFVPPAPPPAQKNNAQLEVPKNERYVAAEPISSLADPIYPPAAVAARAGPVRLVCRLTVDSDGRVAEVEPSLVSLALPNPFSQAFRDAIQSAVAQWRFRPAEMIYLESAPGLQAGTTYLRVVRREHVPAIFEVAFTFSAAGQVKVQSSPGPKDPK